MHTLSWPRVIAAVTLLLLTGSTPPAAHGADRSDPVAEPAGKPNVLLIAVDDLNDWVGCLGGHPQVKTPHMDRLARRGTVFLNAHCQSPLCNPSRTSLLLGLRPSTTGVYALEPWFRTSRPLEKAVTVFQHFSASGYRTLSTGKIFHDAYPPRDEVDREVDEWGFHGGFRPLPQKKIVQGMGDHPLIDWGMYPERDEEQDDWKVASWAVERIESGIEEPFFLAVGIRHPHVPCFATRRWFDLYPPNSTQLPLVRDDDRDDLPPFASYLHWKLPEPRLSLLRAQGEWRPLVRAYLASVSFADSMVGRLLDALDARDLSTRTVVVLWGDNGWHIGEKLMTGKTTLWERSTRVPLIFAGPGVRAGGRCARPAELLDIYPTLVELCGLPGRPELEGHSLVPQLRDPAAPRAFPAITTHGPGNHGIRGERWRYVRYADGSEELYDLEEDPNEWFNLAGDPRHEAAKKELARWLPATDAPPVAGSRTRLIELRDGKPYWEGAAIDPEEGLPGQVEDGSPR